MSAEPRAILIDLAREPSFALGGLDVRPAKLEVVAGERRETLEPRIMQVMVALARQRGAVVSREDLIQSCWGGRIVGEDSINRCIFRLRKLAEQVGGFTLETVPRVGYRLSEDAAPARRIKRRRLAWIALGLAVTALAAAVAGGWWFQHSLPVSAPASPRVAILPFDTLSSDPGVRYFSDGLLDEILDALANDRVETVSRSESAALRAPNARALVGRLGVGLLLDGSVAEANGAIEVRLRLDDPGQRAIIWSETFSRPATEADALQAEVAAKVARITSQALGARAAGVTDAATLSDFVIGDEHSRFDTAGGSAAGEPFYRRVIARAPQFAGGHAYLAIADAFQAYDPGNPRADEQRAEAAREAQEALKLDPKGYDAFIALAMILPVDAGFWRPHEAILQKGMALDPSNPTYPYFLSEDFAAQGRLQAAVESARRAVALDSFWPGPTRDFALLLMDTGQADEGQQVLDRMQRLWPGNWATNTARFWTAVSYGDPKAAVALLADPRTRPSFIDSRTADLWRTSLNALKSDRSGRAGAAAALRAAAGAGVGQFPPAAAVVLLARLGDVDGAFALADKFPIQAGFGGYFLNFPPILFTSQAAPLRRDRRFMSLMATLGLVDYWRTTGNWPDFCAEPGLPYDCKALAARLARQAPG